MSLKDLDIQIPKMGTQNRGKPAILPEFERKEAWGVGTAIKHQCSEHTRQGSLAEGSGR